MAITAAVLDSAADNVDATSKTSASITTDASRLTLAWILNTKTTLPELPTIIDAGRTWVQVATVLYHSIATPLHRLTCFRCMTGATGTLTFDFGGATQTSFLYSVEEFAGVATGGTEGSAAIVQAVTNRSDSSNALTVTLAAFGGADNGVAAAVGRDNSSGVITPGTGFAELTEVALGSGPSVRCETQWRADNDTSVDWSWTTAKPCGGIALELAAAGATLLAAPPAILSWVVPTALVVAGAVSVAAPVASAAWVVPTAVVSGALTVAAPPATTTWVVPTAVASGALTIAASPATTTWMVPSASVVPGDLAVAALPAASTWIVPMATTSGALAIAATSPAVVTWVVPTATVSNVAPNVTVQHVLRGSVERTVSARGSWTRTVTLRGRVG